MNNNTDKSPFNTEQTKPYVQFSKRIIRALLVIFSVIVTYAMIMGVRLNSETIVVTLITSIAVASLGGIIWYMKNSEAEKKALIQLEIQKLNPDLKVDLANPPDEDRYGQYEQ